MLASRLDAYISRYGDFCANDNNNDDNDTTDYFTPLRMRGVIRLWLLATWKFSRFIFYYQSKPKGKTISLPAQANLI